MSAPPDLEQAIALFRQFQGRAPKGREIVELGGGPRVFTALEVGTVLSIGYKALGDGRAYYHEFSAPRAKLYVSADGRDIYFLDGGARFGARGFIG